MKNVLITGAASGIGCCFVERYLERADYSVIAVDREEIQTPKATAQDAGNIESQLLKIQCDFADEASIKAMAKQLGKTPIHLVIHSAGIRGLMPRGSSHDNRSTDSRETYEALDYATLMRTFAVNSAGTFSLLQSIMPLLLSGSSQGEPAKVVLMSSRMGSISRNTSLGGGYAYRASKAALNAIIKSFSVDVPEVSFVLVHPGRVETGLVEFKEEGAMSVNESIDDMMKLIERLESKDSGTFVDRLGDVIEW